MTKLYLAYGSNMNKAQMRRRCPAAKPLRAIVIKDARLVFRGVADIEFCEGAEVPVSLWQITAACEAALDKFEGVAARVYEKVMIPLDNGETALTYVMCNKGIWPPQREYYARIADGYRDFGIDPDLLEVALKHSHAKQEHSAATRRRMVKNIAAGRNVIERKPMHVPLSRIDTPTTTAASASDNEVCIHGWPLGICENCNDAQATATAAPAQKQLPLPKPDPRYDGYKWSERAKAGTAKANASRVVYTTRDATVTNNLRKLERGGKKKNRNLSDWLADRKNGGGNY